MKSRAPLVLMDQLVMILVFALAAALCIRAFALSDRMSRESETRDMAVSAAQNAAETLKSFRGDYEAAARALGGVWNGDFWSISYDSGWSPLPEGAEGGYRLLVTPTDSGLELLGTAEVSARTWQGEELYRLPVAWQEVSHG